MLCELAVRVSLQMVESVVLDWERRMLLKQCGEGGVPVAVLGRRLKIGSGPTSGPTSLRSSIVPAVAIKHALAAQDNQRDNRRLTAVGSSRHAGPQSTTQSALRPDYCVESQSERCHVIPNQRNTAKDRRP